jgi:hypothetical protein
MGKTYVRSLVLLSHLPMHKQIAFKKQSARPSTFNGKQMQQPNPLKKDSHALEMNKHARAITNKTKTMIAQKTTTKKHTHTKENPPAHTKQAGSTMAHG